MREIILSDSGAQAHGHQTGGPFTGRVSVDGDAFEMPLLQAAVIPANFRHGFTTRRGGVSLPPFSSLNLGGKWGDRPEHVAENRRRLGIAAGGRQIFYATQVHGRDTVLVGPEDRPEDVTLARADAVIAPAGGAAVGVYVADCVPVLVADARTGACAAVHAGWRGTVAGVLSATLRRLVDEMGCRMADVRLAIGPSIGPCCFEVGPEVVSAVAAAFPDARALGAIIERAAGARPHADLWMLNRLAAERAGVAPDAIEVAGACTFCEPDRFYSYRRDHGQTGQLSAFIVPPKIHDPRSAVEGKK